MTYANWVGLGGIGALLLLMALRMPIGVAMLLVGIIGFGLLNGWPAAIAALGTYPYQYAAVYDFAVIPLFVLMGNLGSVSGMARDLYVAAYAWIGHIRGGLAHATILACAGFAAVSGSSVASAVTMGKVCLPEMRRYDYSNALSTGVIAAGGTLGILIPPSTAFVIYGLLTEQSIGRLLLAGILPGILLTALFMATVATWMRFRPHYGPPGPRADWQERKRTLGRAGPMMTIVLVSIGGIYVGIFTPSEAAAVGAILALGYALWRRSLGGGNLSRILVETVNTTALVFLILIGALVFGPFLALSGLPEVIAKWLAGLDVHRVIILLIVLSVYIVLGTWMEGFSMLVLTLPIVIPIMQALNYDLIWFGVVMVIVLEMGLIDPPVGINVFIVKGLVPDVPMTEIFKGVLPFWFAMMVCIAILIAVPDIALFIPNTMIGR
ncbi:MAG: TRAP transporter large permease [Alphaproteobacteria bacterium]|nr:TRAP transporter large permease [Alphaproteobacteria bacterium]